MELQEKEKKYETDIGKLSRKNQRKKVEKNNTDIGMMFRKNQRKNVSFNSRLQANLDHISKDSILQAKNSRAFLFNERNVYQRHPCSI